MKHILKKQLLATKNENVDLEKQANNSLINTFLSPVLVSLFVFLLLGSSAIYGQDASFVSGKEYTLDSIQVVGLKSLMKTVISYSGLRRGQKFVCLETR